MGKVSANGPDAVHRADLSHTPSAENHAGPERRNGFPLAGQLRPGPNVASGCWFTTRLRGNCGTVFSWWATGPMSWPVAPSQKPVSTDLHTNNGICCQRSRVKITDITDGTTTPTWSAKSTLTPDYYYDGLDGGDNNSAFGGDNCDLNRWTSNPWDERVLRTRPATQRPDLGSAT